MRTLLYIGILLGLIAVPAQGSNVGDLLPVEVIAVYRDAQGVEIQTDTGNVGTGKSLEAACRDLEENASADIYLDTADYLILFGEAKELTQQLTGYLKHPIRVCMGEGELDVTKTAAYLAAHKPKTTLRDAMKGEEIQVLTQTENGFCLE